MVDYGMELDQAMHMFYNSMTFDKLYDMDTGLYLEGSAYVFEIFKEEQDGNTDNFK